MIMNAWIRWNSIYKNTSTFGDLIAPQGAGPELTAALSKSQYDTIDLEAYESPPPYEVQNMQAIGDYSELVLIRQQLLEAELDNPGGFYVLGSWDYDTGEPMGGVGAPWFPFDEAAALPFMPDGVIEDVWLLTGQKPRAFV